MCNNIYLHDSLNVCDKEYIIVIVYKKSHKILWSKLDNSLQQNCDQNISSKQSIYSLEYVSYSSLMRTHGQNHLSKNDPLV